MQTADTRGHAVLYLALHYPCMHDNSLIIWFVERVLDMMIYVLFLFVILAMIEVKWCKMRIFLNNKR